MLYQFLPRLADDEYTALEQSIREHGVQVPILVDENRAVIDGHHRKEIAERLGVECPRRFAMDLSDEQKRTLALSLNLDRRHLSREQKRELIAKSITADPHLSNRQHAERVGVSHNTVRAVRADLAERGQVDHVSTVTDSLGRQQPARVEPAVNPETGEVSDDYPSDVATGGEVTPPADQPFAQGAGVEEPGEAVEAPPSPPARPAVTGLDGKTYTRPEPAAPRRRPLTDAFTEKRWVAQKAVESLARLVEDDRFPQNAEKVATGNRSDLLRIKDQLELVIDALPHI